MITLLQDKEYRPALVNDLTPGRKVRIECLTLAPFIVVLLRSFLVAGGQVDILTNALAKKQLHGRDFMENRNQLRELGACVFTYEAPHLNHQKVILIEPDIVYLGSHNMTAQSQFNNRETSIRMTHHGFYDKLVAGFCLKTGTKP